MKKIQNEKRSVFYVEPTALTHPGRVWSVCCDSKHWKWFPAPREDARECSEFHAAAQIDPDSVLEGQLSWFLRLRQTPGQGLSVVCREAFFFFEFNWILVQLVFLFQLDCKLLK